MNHQPSASPDLNSKNFFKTDTTGDSPTNPFSRLARGNEAGRCPLIISRQMPSAVIDAWLFSELADNHLLCSSMRKSIGKFICLSERLEEAFGQLARLAMHDTLQEQSMKPWKMTFVVLSILASGPANAEDTPCEERVPSNCSYAEDSSFGQISHSRSASSEHDRNSAA